MSEVRAAAADSRLLLHDVAVQRGLGLPTEPPQSILIEGDRIAAIMPSAEAPTSRGDVEVIDLEGACVMPGMTLGHGHIAYNDVITARDTMFKYSLPEVTLLAADNARRMVQLGYTALVGAGSVAGIDMALKQAIAAGRLEGPRITACSRDLMVSAPPERRNPEVASRFPADLMPIVDSAAAMVERTAIEIEQGAEIIKTFSSGDDTYPNAKSHELLYSLDELKAVVAAARPRGVRVRAHSRGLGGIRNAIEARVDIIDHATYADDAALDAIAEAGIFIIPSLYQPRQLLLHGREHGKTDEFMNALEFQAEIDNTLWMLPEAVKRGIRIATGDDFGFAWTPHGTYADELRVYVEVAGMAPATVLSWATSNGAALAGRGADAGSVEVGKLADLVVVASDPVQDIGVLTDPSKILMTLLAGRVVRDIRSKGLPQAAALSGASSR